MSPDTLRFNETCMQILLARHLCNAIFNAFNVTIEKTTVGNKLKKNEQSKSNHIPLFVRKFFMRYCSEATSSFLFHFVFLFSFSVKVYFHCRRADVLQYSGNCMNLCVCGYRLCRSINSNRNEIKGSQWQNAENGLAAQKFMNQIKPM